MILVSEADIFLSESLRILTERLSQSEPQLPLRQICCYSHYANIIFLKFSQNPSNLQQPNRLPHICHPFQPDIRPWFQFTDIDHRKNASCKSHLDCLMDSLLCHRDGAHLSGESDLAKYDRFLIQRTVFIAGNQIARSSAGSFIFMPPAMLTYASYPDRA